MHILHIIQRYAPARGGAEIHLAEISKHLVAQGHDVTVVTTDAHDFELFWDPQKRRLKERTDWIDGVKVIRFPIRHLPLSKLMYPAIRRLLWLLSFSKIVPVSILHRIARFTPWVPALQQWLQTTDEEFDLVAGMTICFEPLLEMGVQFANQRHIPFVIYPLTHLGAGSKPAHDTLSRFYTMRHQLSLVLSSDVLMAQTKTEGDFYHQHGLAKQNITIAGPGIHPDVVTGGDGQHFRQQYNINHPIVLSVGSMSEDKGTPYTIQAVQHLWRTGIELDLVLIGTPLSPFKRFFDTLPDEDRRRIHLLGAVDDTVKKDALAACDMLVMPSRTDSFGIVYLEAWVNGKPVIGADTWGVNTVITAENGLLVPFGDIPALADAIMHLLTEPEKAIAMGKHGQKMTLAEHTWQHKAVLSEKVYTALLTQSVEGL